MRMCLWTVQAQASKGVHNHAPPGENENIWIGLNCISLAFFTVEKENNEWLKKKK